MEHLDMERSLESLIKFRKHIESNLRNIPEDQLRVVATLECHSQKCSVKMKTFEDQARKTFEKFKLDRGQTLTYNEDQIHKYDRLKLDECLNRTIRLFNEHCLKGTERAFQAMLDWYREDYKKLLDAKTHCEQDFEKFCLSIEDRTRTLATEADALGPQEIHATETLSSGIFSASDVSSRGGIGSREEEGGQTEGASASTLFLTERRMIPDDKWISSLRVSQILVESETQMVSELMRLQQEDIGHLETAKRHMVLLTSPARGGTALDREVKHFQTPEIHESLSSSAERFFFANSTVLRVVQCAGGPCGIALLGAELFVLTDRSERVAVYDLETYSETRHVTIPNLKNPQGLAACQKNNCLYISDSDMKCIYRLDLLNKPTAFGKWSLRAGPSGVSLSRVFNLLVTLPQSIDEYKTSGSLIRSIKLDVSLDNPLHSIELSNDQFVVCHAGSTQHRVCVVDTAGRIVHSYGGPPGSSVGQLNGPRSLAVDARYRVFVADCNNDRVQVLSPTLTRLGDVTTPGHRLSGPCVLHLDELNGRLYIGEMLTSKVLVVESV